MKLLKIIILTGLILAGMGTVSANENILATKLINLSLHINDTTGESYYILTAHGSPLSLNIYEENVTATDAKSVVGIFSMADYDVLSALQAANTTHISKNNTNFLPEKEFLTQYPTPGYNTTRLNGSIGTLQLDCQIKTFNGQTVSEILTIKNALKMAPQSKSFKGINSTDENGHIVSMAGTSRIVIIRAKT